MGKEVFEIDFSLFILDQDMADVFGRIMIDAALGREAIHKVERDDGRVDECPGTRYVEKYEHWDTAEREAISEAKGRVLDIGCGAGRVMSYLQEQGLHVIGIDISEGALQACKMRGLKNVRLMSAEALRFPVGHFDTVILYGSNFGVLGEEGRIVGMLRDLHRVTTQDAVMLASSKDASATEDQRHLAYHERNRKLGLPIGQTKIRLSYGGITEEWHWLRLASPEEMSEISARAGWNLSRIYGSPRSFVGVLHKQE